MHARLQLSLIILLIPRTYAAWLSIYRTPFTHRATSVNRAARDQEILHDWFTLLLHVLEDMFTLCYIPNKRRRRWKSRGTQHPIIHNNKSRLQFARDHDMWSSDALKHSEVFSLTNSKEISIGALKS